jgi:hypothetical protein
MKSPTQCVLWGNPALVAPQKARFERLDTYVDDDHLTRSLLRCRECGQLYFFEFREEIDWDGGGNDPQYSTYIPIENDTEIDALRKASSFELLSYFPRLQRDFPKEAQAPTARWVGK